MQTSRSITVWARHFMHNTLRGGWMIHERIAVARLRRRRVEGNEWSSGRRRVEAGA